MIFPLENLRFLYRPSGHYAPELFKAALQVVVAEEQALDGPESCHMEQWPKSACTPIEGRPTGPLVADRGAKLLTTLRLQLIHSAALREGVAAERNTGESAVSLALIQWRN